MEVENVQSYNYHDFIESNPMTGVDDMELVREEAPAELKRDNRTFALAGLTSVLAGAAIFIGTNFMSFASVESFAPFVIGAGVLGLGFGVLKAFRKIFRRKNLNLPSLQIRRKTEKYAAAEVRPVETYRPGKRLTKSRTDSVIMGVCGGLAKHSGISSAMLRLFFIGAFAITGGAAAILYFLLGAFLPLEKHQPTQISRGRGNRKVLRP